MKISFVSLFPKMFEGFEQSSIIARAIKKGLLEIETVNFRDWSQFSNKSVDDTPYGGGAGMVLRLEPIVSCLNKIKTNDSCVILTSPSGEKYNQRLAKSLSKYNHLILISGHYEGFDARIKHYVDTSISIGDFILTGGEIPSMVIADSVARLIPGVINSESLDSESFNDNLLDFEVYTKPVDFEGHKVPEVLLSGNHQKIAAWRKNNQLELTKQKRPDLYKKYIKNNKE